MTLREFLKYCKKIVDENPQALEMEMFATHGASGALYEMSSPSISKIDSWDNSEFPIKEMLSRDYAFDSVIDVYIGN